MPSVQYHIMWLHLSLCSCTSSTTCFFHTEVGVAPGVRAWMDLGWGPRTNGNPSPCFAQHAGAVDCNGEMMERGPSTDICYTNGFYSYLSWSRSIQRVAEHQIPGPILSKLVPVISHQSPVPSSCGAALDLHCQSLAGAEGEAHEELRL